MKISLVVALSHHRVIGRSGGLPWRLPADLKRFREITWGKTMLMGRKTYDSIGRALPGRRNIIVTRNPDFRAPGCEIAPTPEAAVALCEGAEEITVIGGAQLFIYFLPRADRIYLTEVDADVPGDVHFPGDPRAEFKEVQCEEREADTQNPYRMVFSVLDRA